MARSFTGAPRAATARIADRGRGEPLLPTLPMGGVVPHQNPLRKLRDRDRGRHAASTLNGGEELGYLPLVVHQNLMMGEELGN